MKQRLALEIEILGDREDYSVFAITPPEETSCPNC